MVEEFDQNPLWPLLVEAIHKLPMYPSHKAYVRDRILIEEPDVSAQEVAYRLKAPMGEAYVILYELKHSGNEGRTGQATT